MLSEPIMCRNAKRAQVPGDLIFVDVKSNAGVTEGIDVYVLRLAGLKIFV